MLACHPKLQGHVFARNFVDQSQIDDSLLHLVQRNEATERKGLLLCPNHELVAGNRFRSKIVENFLVGNMRSCIVVTATPVTRDVAREST